MASLNFDEKHNRFRCGSLPTLLRENLRSSGSWRKVYRTKSFQLSLTARVRN